MTILDANIRLSSGEMQLLGKKSVPFADGTNDFLGTLDIYHQLHCRKPSHRVKFLQRLTTFSEIYQAFRPSGLLQSSGHGCDSGRSCG